MIVDRIIEDARRDARLRVKDAEKRAEEILAEAQRKDAALRAAQAEERVRAARENEERMCALSESERRFAKLKVRTELADAAFSRSVELLSSLPPEEAERFWGGLLEKFGEEGEEVIFSLHEKTLGADFVARVSEKCGKKLRAASAGGRFSGGMILRGPHCDKNLTAEMLVREFREREEANVLALLFGEA